MDERELDVGEGGAGGQGEAERIRRDRPPRVERPVDRIDHHDEPSGAAEAHLPALLGDREEVEGAFVKPLELGEHDVLGAAIEPQRAIAALAPPLVRRALGDPWLGGEEPALLGHYPPAGGEPAVL